MFSYRKVQLVVSAIYKGEDILTKNYEIILREKFMHSVSENTPQMLLQIYIILIRENIESEQGEI